MKRSGRLLRLGLRRWWRSREWTSIRRWTLLGVAAWLLCAGLVGGLGHLAGAARPAPASSPEPVAGAAAHPLDGLIARTAAEIMPPHWDWRLLKAMVQKESTYDPRARSPGGAVGLTQMLPATARHMGLSRGQFFDAEANLAAGTRYLRRLYDRFHELPDRAPRWLRTRLAIASYNAGPGRVDRALERAGGRDWSALTPHLPDSTVHHVERIVDDFYPRFGALEQEPGRPRIGNWKPRLRFWESDLELGRPLEKTTR